MPRTEYLSKDGTLASDDWRSLLNLLGYPASARVNLIEGFINVQSFAAVFQLVPEGGQAPSGSTGGGVIRSAASVTGFGPASGKYKGYPLHRLWVRNSSAGSNATIAVEGVAEVE